MFITLYILSLLVGGVIGYVTNAIDNRMLFRPHTETALRLLSSKTSRKKLEIPLDYPNISPIFVANLRKVAKY